MEQMRDCDVFIGELPDGRGGRQKQVRIRYLEPARATIPDRKPAGPGMLRACLKSPNRQSSPTKDRFRVHICRSARAAGRGQIAPIRPLPEMRPKGSVGESRPSPLPPLGQT